MNLAAPFLKDLPVIETPRLILRKLRLMDAADMLEYTSDREIALSTLNIPLELLVDSVYEIEDALEGYANNSLLDWAIEYRGDGRMIGRIGLLNYHMGHARADLGYALNRKYWGQGLATEAARAVIDFGFGTLRLNRIGAFVLPDNAASMRVLAKIGMQHEGIQREVNAIRGTPEDLHGYSILAREWRQHGG